VNFADDTDAWNITVVDPTTTPPTVAAQLKPDLVTYDPATGDSAFSDGQTVDATTNTGTPANPAAFNLALTVNPSPANPNSPNATPGSPAPNPFQTTLDLSGMTQYGTSFAPIELSQDGYTAGELTNISVGSDGMITASYSNGVTRAESQVALASFRNVQGLIPVGDNDWIASSASGPAVFGAAGSGVFGSLQSGALEDSNVDLTNELVNMMTAQRAYQANAQTIKTQDQVFSTLVNLR
jgi:flagellar hook protein FlgE